MQSLKSAGARRCQSRSTGSSCYPDHPVELIKLLKTTYKKWQPVCFRESEEAKSMIKNEEKNCYSRHESDLKTTHHEKLYLRLVYLIIIHLLQYLSFSDLINGFSRTYATISHARFKEKGRDKKSEKAAFFIARMKFLLNFQTQKTTQERIVVKIFFFFISSTPSATSFTPA